MIKHNSSLSYLIHHDTNASTIIVATVSACVGSGDRKLLSPTGNTCNRYNVLLTIPELEDYRKSRFLVILINMFRKHFTMRNMLVPEMKNITARL